MILRLFLTAALLLLGGCATLPPQGASTDPLLWVAQAAPEAWMSTMTRHPRFQNEPMQTVVMTPNVLSHEIAARLSLALANNGRSVAPIEAPGQCPTVFFAVTARPEANGLVAVTVLPLDGSGDRLSTLAPLHWRGLVSVPDYRRARAVVTPSREAVSSCLDIPPGHGGVLHADATR